MHGNIQKRHRHRKKVVFTTLFEIRWFQYITQPPETVNSLHECLPRCPRYYLKGLTSEVCNIICELLLYFRSIIFLSTLCMIILVPSWLHTFFIKPRQKKTKKYVGTLRWTFRCKALCFLALPLSTWKNCTKNRGYF